MPLLMNAKLLTRLIFNYNNNKLFIRMEKTLVNIKSHNDKRSRQYLKLKRLLINQTALADNKIKYILRKHENLYQLSHEQIVKNLEICKDLNVNLHTIVDNIEFIYLTQDELINRILLLKEMGGNYINTTMINSLANAVPMTLFKAYTGIPEHVNVSEMLYSYLHKPPPRIPPLKHINDNITVHNYRQMCLNHYLRWRLELSDPNEKLLNYWTVKLKFKPFSNIKYAFDILHYNWQMSVETIWKYKCLLNCSVNDLKRIYDEIQTICGVSMLELLKSAPELYQMKYNNIIYIKQCLEMNNITGEQLRNSPQILLLDKNEFFRLWKAVMATPELRSLLQHSFLLRAFLLKDDFVTRIEYLRYLNVPCSAINIFSTSPYNFERCIRSGAFRYRANEISLALSKKFKQSSSYIREMLNHHPHWRHVDLINIYNTLDYLKTRFMDNDIKDNLHLLLYSKDKVEKVLENVIINNELAEESNRFTPSQLLALCLYEIEKKNHFTGDGIWGKHQQKIHKISDKVHNQIGHSRKKLR